MNRNRTAAILIGCLICTPLLALYELGLFADVARWFEALYHRIFALTEPLRPQKALQYGYYTLLAFITAWVGIEMSSNWHRLGFFLGATFLTVTLGLILVFTGVLFEPVSGIAAIWGAGIASIAVGGILNGRRAHIMRGLFAGRISAQAFDELVRHDKPAELTGRRELTILSCQLLNPAEIAAEIDGEKFESIISRLQRGLSEFIVTRGGYLDDCDAHSLRALFGYPLADEHHALHAAQVAAALRSHLAALARELEPLCGVKPRIGVALNTGDAMCGLLGMEDFQSFSASGESCDLTDRLCLLNSIYGSRVLLAPRTYARVKEGIEVRPLEMLYTAAGHPIGEVYELLAEKGALPEADARARDAFWQGVVQYRQGENDKALASFQNATVEDRDDAPVRYFLDLVTAHLKDSAKKSIPKHGRLLAA
jgi:class 3 adenylate cyclase